MRAEAGEKLVPLHKDIISWLLFHENRRRDGGRKMSVSRKEISFNVRRDFLLFRFRMKKFSQVYFLYVEV